ncbi:hypothetical protein BHS05_08335 [Myxococcus xanthus]|nr:hypothetical protein BHS05_08335 [Myxococcus xanthus]
MPHIDHYGSTSLFTTITDLLKWEQNLLDARVGGLELIAAMQTSGRLNDGTGTGTVTGYGSGLHLSEYRGLRTVSHDGMEAGYRTEALLFPDQRLEVTGGAQRQVGMPTAFVHIGEGAFRPGESMHVWRFSAPEGTPRALSIRATWPATRDFIRVSEPLPSGATAATNSTCRTPCASRTTRW